MKALAFAVMMGVATMSSAATPKNPPKPRGAGVQNYYLLAEGTGYSRSQAFAFAIANAWSDNFKQLHDKGVSVWCTAAQVGAHIPGTYMVSSPTGFGGDFDTWYQTRARVRCTRYNVKLYPTY